MPAHVWDGSQWVETIAFKRTPSTWTDTNDNGWVWDGAQWVQFQPEFIDGDIDLLPVENMIASEITDSHARVDWDLPVQPEADPNEVWIQVPEISEIWMVYDYPITSWQHNALFFSTEYQVQVRLGLRVDGEMVAFSPSRSVFFTTLAPTVPTLPEAPDPGDPDPPDWPIIVVPPPGPGCTLDEWTIERSDDGGETIEEYDSGTDFITDPVTGLPAVDLTAIDFEGGWQYRVCTDDSCTGHTCGPWFVIACEDPASMATEPFNDPDLVLWVPGICQNQITDAASDTAGAKGPNFGTFYVDDDQFYVVSEGEGLVGYGDAPLTANKESSDYTIHIEFTPGSTPDAALLRGWRNNGMAIEFSEDSGAVRPHGKVFLDDGTSVSITDGSVELALDNPWKVTLTHDPVLGELLLYVDGELVASSIGPALEHDRQVFLDIWELYLPDDTSATNCAAWARALTAEEIGLFRPGIIEFIDVNVQTGNGAIASVGFTAPATRQAGDLLLFHITDEDATTRATPTGWKIVGNATPSTAVTNNLFMRIATNDANDNPTFIINGDYIGRISVWRNCDANVELVATTEAGPQVARGVGIVVDTDTNSTVVANAQTAKNLYCVAAHFVSVSEAVTATDSLGYDELYDSTHSDIAAQLYASQLGRTTGTIPADTITFSGAVAKASVISVLLRPLCINAPTILIGAATNGHTATNIPYPASGVTAGDELFLILSIPQGTTTVPSDWQLIDEVAGTANYLRVYRRLTLAAGTESGTNISVNGTRFVASIIAVRGHGGLFTRKANWAADGVVTTTIPLGEEIDCALLGILESQSLATPPLRIQGADGHILACRVNSANAGSAGTFNSLTLSRSDINSGEVNSIANADAGNANDIHHIVAGYLFGTESVNPPGGPTCTITRQASSTNEPMTGGSVVFDIVFSASVTGLQTSDILLGGTAAWGNVTPGSGIVLAGSGTTYTLTISNLIAAGTITAKVQAGAALDGSGVGNQESNTETIHWNLLPSVTVIGEANGSTSAATLTLTTSVAVAVGDMIVVGVAADNAGASGASSIASVSDSAGNVYSLRQSANQTAGAANDGASYALFTAPCTSPLASGQTITINFSPNTVSRVAQARKITPSGTGVLAYLEGNTNANSSNAISVATSANLILGDVVVAGIARENPNGPSADTDTTNGSWSSSLFEGATNFTSISQTKVVTGAGAQTFNSGGSQVADEATAIIVIRQS